MSILSEFDEKREALAARTGVIRVRTLRVMGRAGDEPRAFPMITSLAVVDEDVKAAIDEAERIIHLKQSEGMQAAVVEPGGAPDTGMIIRRMMGFHEPLRHDEEGDIVLLPRVVGG